MIFLDKILYTITLMFAIISILFTLFHKKWSYKITIIDNGIVIERPIAYIAIILNIWMAGYFAGKRELHHLYLEIYAIMLHCFAFSFFLIAGIYLLFMYWKYSPKDCLLIYLVSTTGVMYWITNAPKWGIYSSGILPPLNFSLQGIR